jgi:lipopolysaccharide/colanic/teichoic acid biosynthesis glycosyltransferase
MAKRLFDVMVAALASLLAAPLVALAALGIRLSSPGPVLHRARRIGRYGRPFTMYKLRTMHRSAPAHGAPITAVFDPRVFPLGAVLRRTKIDELPQLWNVLRGEMSIVGPRPEDPAILRQHYSPLHHETLCVRPGLASPGSLYQYTRGDVLLEGQDHVRAYVERLLPLKLALDLVYVRRASLRYDLAIIARTAWTIVALLLGRRAFREPPELPEARRLLLPRPGLDRSELLIL